MEMAMAASSSSEEEALLMVVLKAWVLYLLPPIAKQQPVQKLTEVMPPVTPAVRQGAVQCGGSTFSAAALMNSMFSPEHVCPRGGCNAAMLLTKHQQQVAEDGAYQA